MPQKKNPSKLRIAWIARVAKKLLNFKFFYALTLSQKFCFEFYKDVIDLSTFL